MSVFKQSLISRQLSLIFGLTLPFHAMTAKLALATETEVVLGEIMTTAKRTESTAEAASGNATIVNRAEIERTPRASVKELVRGQEGVMTGQLRGQSDLAPEITLRGIPNQARTMILIDGIPVQTSYSGQAQAVGGLNVEDIRQVEIVRGPYSSLYGSSAMGGVVNFVTAMPKESEFRASLGYGDAFENGRAQQQMIRGHVSGTEVFSDHLKVKVSYGWLDSGGYYSDFATSTSAPAAGITGAERSATTTGGSQYIHRQQGTGRTEQVRCFGPRRTEGQYQRYCWRLVHPFQPAQPVP